MMEKYYVIGTTILSLGLTVPAYGLHQFGYVQPTFAEASCSMIAIGGRLTTRRAGSKTRIAMCVYIG